LAALPADLLSRLHEAVVELDQDQTLVLIEEIKSVDAHIARALEIFARNLAYGTLLDLLEETEMPEHGDRHG
jgi:hypothetical protein